MRQEKRTKIITISLFCVAFIIIALTATYAYYQSTIAGTVNGTIATWSFTANNQTSTMNLDFGELYPGKSGVYNLELSAEDSDLPVTFELIFHFVDDMRLSHASFLKLSLSSEPGVWGLKGFVLEGEKITIPIYYDWPYDDPVNDWVEMGTTVQEADVNIPITIIARQIDFTDDTTFNNTLFSTDLLGITSATACSAPRYGWSCNYAFTLGDDFVQIGEEVEYELKNGLTDTIPKYVTIPLVPDGAN